MSTQHMDRASTQALKELDFLSHPFAPSDGIARTGRTYQVIEPWALAKFGTVRLGAGWWVFECEGGEGASEAEVRLGTDMDPLIVLRGVKGEGGASLQVRGVLECRVSLFVSGWPAERRFDVLRLRRLSGVEEARLLSNAVLRLARSKRLVSSVAHVADRLVKGVPLALRSGSVKNAGASADTSPRPVAVSAATPVVRDLDEAVVQLQPDDVLHSRAAEIVAGIFARQPSVQAIYCDANEGGVITPAATWDAELAKHASAPGAPIFMRGQANLSAGKPVTLAGIAAANGEESLKRVALPLVSRARPVRTECSIPAAPNLSRLPSVSAVIPTKYRMDLLQACLRGLAGVTAYPNLDVIIVDNGSTDPRLPEILDEARRSFPVKLIRDDGAFNFSRLVNTGVRQATGEILALLNDDIEPVESGWLHRMVESSMQPDVGVVGARLLYPDRTLQHGGVVLGIGGVAGHLWKGMSEAEASEHPQLVLPGTRMAVTGACITIRRELYDQVNGFDEAYSVALNDIDFCLRVRAAGFRTIYRGDAALIHHESQSRGLDNISRERRERAAAENRLFLSRWEHLLDADPHGSPAIDPRFERVQVHDAVWR